MSLYAVLGVIYYSEADPACVRIITFIGGLSVGYCFERGCSEVFWATAGALCDKELFRWRG